MDLCIVNVLSAFADLFITQKEVDVRRIKHNFTLLPLHSEQIMRQVTDEIRTEKSLIFGGEFVTLNFFYHNCYYHRSGDNISTDILII